MRRPLVLVLALQCLIIITLTELFHIPLYKTAYSGAYENVITVEGTVKSVQIKQSYAALTLDVGREKILVRLTGIDDETDLYSLSGRRVRATGRIEKASGARNPGCFNYEIYLRARGIYSLMEVSKYKLEVGGIVRPLTNYLSVQKGLFYSNMKEMIGEDDASLIFAVLFGDKSFLDDDVYTQFQTNGIAHVLAVSGLHVGLIYALLRKLIKRKDWLVSVFSVVFLFLYIILADYSVSVIRAAVMIVLQIIAFHSMKRYDMLSAACFTAMIMLFVNPYFIYDSGMQLSFLAVYSLAVIFPWCDDRLKRFCDKRKNERLYTVGSLLLPGIVLQAAMMPLTAFHFLNFAPLAVFVNPIAIYIASLLLPAGLLCFLVHPFKLLLSGAAGVSYAISHALKFVSALADRLLPGFSVPAPPLSMLLLYYALLFYFFSEMRHIMIRRGRSNTVAVGFIALALSCCVLPVLYGKSMSPFPWKYNEYKAVFVDIGQGDCTHIRSQGVNVLIDGGGSYYKDIAGDSLKPYLLKNGVTHIDIAMVTHLDTDHSKGIADLSQQMRIDSIVFPESVRGSDVSSFNAGEIIYVKEGDVIRAGDAEFTVLSAGYVGSDPNEGSLVTLCSIGELDILLTGDAPVSVENRIVRDGFHDMHIEVLKAGHHGSSTSTGPMLLASISFDMAVISCGKNNRYGHPSAETISRLDASGIRIRRTDLEGAICIR